MRRGKGCAKNIAAGRNLELGSLSAIRRIWVRNMNGPVELTVYVSVIKNVNSFRSAMITLLHFRANWISTQRYFVSLQNLAAAHQLQRSFLL